MANLVVTSSTNSISVAFNDQPFFDSRTGGTYSKGTWMKSYISSIKLINGGAYVNVLENDGFEWMVSQNGASGTFTVDSVNAVAPTSNSDLYDKLIAIIS